MTTVSELRKWLARMNSSDDVYIDEGGLTLRGPGGAYTEIGGDPNDEEPSPTPPIQKRQRDALAFMLKGEFPWLGTDEEVQSCADEVSRLGALYAILTAPSPDSAQEPVDRQTRADLISALNLAITADQHRIVIGTPKSPNPAMLERWEAIRDGLLAKELAQ